MATDADHSPLLTLLQLSDSAYPTGAYAHSFGLESLVELGLIRNIRDAEAFLCSHGLPALAHTELPYVIWAHEAAPAQELDRICALDAEYHALRPTREMREASSRIGAQRVALAAECWGGAWLRALHRAYEEHEWRGHLPIAFGAIGAAVGISRADTVAAYTYQQISGAIAALIKLLRIGQRAAQALLTRLLAESIRWQARAQQLDRDSIGWFTPGLDIASARHETAYTRLFIS